MELNRVVEAIRKIDEILVVGHHDADGLTATGIMVLALERAGKDVEWMILKQLYSEDVERIADKGKPVIFVDMGSGQLDVLKQHLDLFFVLDHHEPPEVFYEFHLNPWNYGYDGSREISGAGMAYLVARELGENKDLAALAVVGAVGDMQAENGLVGKNREILRDAIESGRMFAYKDILLYGRFSRPLLLFLMLSTSPIIPGITGNEAGALNLLVENDIELTENGWWRTYSDLTIEEKRRLVTALVLRLASWGLPTKIVGEVYDLNEEERVLRDAKEFSTLLNACGRYGEEETGLRIVMGDRGRWLKRGKALLQKHRKTIRTSLELAFDNLEERNGFFLFYCEKIPHQVVGIVAGLVHSSGLIPMDLPVVGITKEEPGWLKISARGPRAYDLGKTLRELSKKVGGEGGGHPVAAGARIPRDSLEEFLELLERSFSELSS